MSIKIVVVDAGQLPQGVELLAFPDVDCADPIDHYAARGETGRVDL